MIEMTTVAGTRKGANKRHNPRLPMYLTGPPGVPWLEGTSMKPRSIGCRILATTGGQTKDFIETYVMMGGWCHTSVHFMQQVNHATQKDLPRLTTLHADSGGQPGTPVPSESIVFDVAMIPEELSIAEVCHVGDEVGRLWYQFRFPGPSCMRRDQQLSVLPKAHPAPHKSTS